MNKKRNTYCGADGGQNPVLFRAQAFYKVTGDKSTLTN